MLGEPPLLPNEDREAYEAVLSSLGIALGPKSIFDWVLVRDVAILDLEIQRMRTAKVGIIGVSEKEALRSIFESVFENENLQEKDRMLEAELKADDWYMKPAARKELVALLSRYRLDHQAITGEAIALRLHEIGQLESLIASAELRRSAMIREIRVYRDNFVHRRYEDYEGIEVVQPLIEEFSLEPPPQRRPPEPETIDALPDLSEADQ